MVQGAALLMGAGVIKQDIQAMNAAIVELQAVSSSDHDRNRQSQDHSVVVVRILGESCCVY